VLNDLRLEHDLYSRRFGPSVSYWQQLGTRGEVGWLTVVVAIVGLAVLLQSPRSRVTTIAYVALMVTLYAALVQSSYQPFRNLLPLVPFMCIAVASAVVFGARFIRTRFALQAPAFVAIALVPALVLSWALFDTGDRPFIDAAQSRIDTRVQARRWLEQRVRPNDRILVSRELAFLPSELQQLDAHVRVRSQLQPFAVTKGYDYVLVGALGAQGAGWAYGFGLETTPQVASFGDVPANGWRGNREQIRIFRRAAA
jgi:hypothetical protein